MLTRNDMTRLATSLPTANQMAFDIIMPNVNKQIRAAAVSGLDYCEIDVPTILDSAPAFEYDAVCKQVQETLQKGEFTVEEKDVGLFRVAWEERAKRTDVDDTDQVKIVYTKPPRRRKKKR